jgi:ABC-type Fe3+-hydroxamate transport system substrate-binding protein
LDQKIIGITKFCVHPDQAIKTKQLVGGTKDFSISIIEKLQPDLIFANKEENDKARIEKLQQQFPVWVSDVNTLYDALEMINQIGRLTNREHPAQVISKTISQSFSKLAMKRKGLSVLYLIWRKPWMGAGGNTFINDMLHRLGLVNVLCKQHRYPILSSGEIKDLNPDYIFLSSEPFPFREKHILEIKTITPSSEIMLVDGEMFSWYGSRLTKAVEYFNSIF